MKMSPESGIKVTAGHLHPLKPMERKQSNNRNSGQNEMNNLKDLRTPLYSTGFT